MDSLIISGEEIFRFLEEREITVPILEERAFHVLYETSNTIIKKSYHTNKNAINDFGDYAFESPILLEAFCLNILRLNNEKNFPKLFDVFTNDGYLCLEIEKIEGIPLSKIYKNLNDSEKNAIVFQLLYILYISEVFEFSHGDLIGSNIMIEFCEIENVKYIINGQEYQISNEGINVKLIDFEFSRLTVYKTYLFNENIRKRYFPKEYTVPFNPALDIGKILGNPHLISDEFHKLFKDIQFNFNWKHQVISPFPEINSLMILHRILGLPKITFHHTIKTINEVKTIETDDEDIKNLIENPSLVQDKSLLFERLSRYKYNRLIYKFLVSFHNFKFDLNRIYAGMNSYSNNRKIINKILSLINNKEDYIKPNYQISSYRIDDCLLSTGNTFNPITLEYVISEQWLLDEENIIIKINNKLYASKSVYFKDIPSNNLLVDVSFPEIKYLNLNRYGIDAVVDLEMFILSLDLKTIELTLFDKKSLVNNIYFENHPKFYFNKTESDFYGYEEKEFKSLQNYTYKWDKAINKYLRSNIEDELYLKDKEFLKYYSDFGDFPEEALENIKDAIKNIDNAFLSSYETDHEIVLFRGIEERTIYDGLSLGYTSTTTLKASALKFTKDQGVVYTIIIPKGIPYISLENFTTFKGEKEYLLPRNLFFKHIGNYEFTVELQNKEQFEINKDFKLYPVYYAEQVKITREIKENKCYKNNVEDGNLIDEITADVIDPDNSINEDGLCFNISTVLYILKQCFKEEEEEDEEDDDEEYKIDFLNPFTRLKFKDENIIKIINSSKDISLDKYLIFFSKNDHLEVVKHLVQNGADVNSQNNKALIYTAGNGNLEIVKYLVQNGADVTAKNNKPLIAASENGHLEVLKYLVQNGADLTDRDNEALIYSSLNGHLEIVKYLVQNGADVKAKDNWSLIFASSNGYLEIVKYLIENGADIITQHNKPLIRASENGYLEIVKYLVQNGADVTAQHNGALIYSSLNGHLEIVKYLIENGADIRAQHNGSLIEASEKGHLEIVKYLVQNGADITAQHNGALIEASKNGYLEIVKYLVENGADVKTRDNEALIKASKNGYLEIVKYLVQNGANIDRQALIKASEKGHLEIVKYLVENGKYNRFRKTQALIYASLNGQLEIIKYLVQNGADVTAQDNLALIKSSEKGQLEIVKYLIENGADVTAQDNLALIKSSEKGHFQIVKYLIENGANVSAQNNLALLYASNNHHSYLVKYLVQNGAEVTYGSK